MNHPEEYAVLFFKGRGDTAEGKRECIRFTYALEEYNKTTPTGQIGYMMEALPLIVVNEYGLRQENGGDAGRFCFNGIILRSGIADKVEKLLKEKGKAEGVDFIMCQPDRKDKRLDSQLANWDSVWPDVMRRTGITETA